MTADAGDRAPEPILADDHDDTGPGDTGPGDTGPGDTGPGDTGPGDTGPGDTGPDEPATPEGAQAEGSQSELDLGVLSTGSVTVDSALAPLDGLAERPVSGHAEVFEQVLDELAQTMAEPTDEHGSTGPGVPPASH